MKWNYEQIYSFFAILPMMKCGGCQLSCVDVLGNPAQLYVRMHDNMKQIEANTHFPYLPCTAFQTLLPTPTTFNVLHRTHDMTGLKTLSTRNMNACTCLHLLMRMIWNKLATYSNKSCDTWFFLSSGVRLVWCG